MSEWFKELVLKTSDSERDRGFESHLLRLFLTLIIANNILLLGEVPKLAEGTPLERVQVVNSGARVQIPPSPFFMKYMKTHNYKIRNLVPNLYLDK